MSKLLSLSFCLLISLLCCTAAKHQQQQYGREQQYQLNQCQIQSLTAQEPKNRLEAEAGVTEYWDWNDQQFQCAGVAPHRSIIQPRGLLLPKYTNAPQLVYVVQGKGMTGVLMSGCPETFQSSEQFSQEREKGQESQRFLDQHQQIRHFSEGDIIALPAGVAHWCYNNGQEDLVLVVVEHTSNYQNQLDNNPRQFMLAGDPHRGQQQERGQYRTGVSSKQQHKQNIGNVFRGFDTQVLADVFGVDQETARRLQGHDDERGHIIRVEGELQVIRPPRSIQQEQQQGGRGSQWADDVNGVEETICSSRLVQNINDPSRADFFNPRAGRITTMNRNNLPILSYLQLSAERGVLYSNAIKAPHWKQNAHTVIYATRGECQMQIVDQRGQAVMNDRISEGQLVVVPQNFVVVKQASSQGFEWISFKTSDNARFNTLAGRTSAIRAMPIDVLSNAYQISREQARNLKLNREEVIVFEASQRSKRSVA